LCVSTWVPNTPDPTIYLSIYPVSFLKSPVAPS
jgi:hypothetical protein